MAHTEGLVREISKEVLSQYCSYRKKLLFKACFLKHNSFKDFTHPYLTDIHFLFSQTSFASVSPRRNETRKNYSVLENWTWRPKFGGISMNFTSLLSVSRAGEVFVPGDSWTHHHTDCSLPPPHAQKRALSGVPRQSCTCWNTLHCPISVCEETQSSSFASPTILLVTSLSVEG